MKCIFHRTDYDGKCSGAIVYNKFTDCELYPIDYVDIFDFNKIEQGEQVIMVDFTLEGPDQMLELATLSDLIWIDHHKSALEIEKHNDLKDVKGVRKEGVGACELVWKMLNPTKRLPYSIFLLSKYDVWQNEGALWKDAILPFQYGMRLHHGWPDETNFWEPLFNTTEESELIKDIIKEGRAAQRYDENLSERVAKGLWFPIEFEGLKFQVINRSHANSLSGESIWNPEEYHALMFFARGPDKWKITMFTDRENIDLSKIAKKHGGGGHKQACGFSTNNIMDVIPQLINI